MSNFNFDYAFDRIDNVLEVSDEWYNNGLANADLYGEPGDVWKFELPGQDGLRGIAIKYKDEENIVLFERYSPSEDGERSKVIVIHRPRELSFMLFEGQQSENDVGRILGICPLKSNIVLMLNKLQKAA